jgi:NTE family protein
MAAPRWALVLGGGGARGLAHIGVLEVLEEEGLRPSFLVGTSMGGVVAALSAAGQPADRILELARGFRFPRWFIPGGLVTWNRIFAPAARALVGLSFGQLALPVAVIAVDLEAGRQVVLHEGPLLPALRATCAVPGVLPPVEVEERWLVDGALVNALPVDVAAMADPDLVVAVRAGGHGPRSMPDLRRPGQSSPESRSWFARPRSRSTARTRSRRPWWSPTSSWTSSLATSGSGTSIGSMRPSRPGELPPGRLSRRCGGPSAT